MCHELTFKTMQQVMSGQLRDKYQCGRHKNEYNPKALEYQPHQNIAIEHTSGEA